MLCDEITTSLSNLRDFSLDSLPHVCTYSTVLFMLGRMTSALEESRRRFFSPIKNQNTHVTLDGYILLLLTYVSISVRVRLLYIIIHE